MTNVIISGIFDVTPVAMYDATFEFRYYCGAGDLRRAKEILAANPKIDISADDEYAFRVCCISGHANVAEWLLKIKPEINISMWDEWSFKAGCIYGYLEIAQLFQNKKPWLYSFTSETDSNGNTTIEPHIKTVLEQRWYYAKYILWLSHPELSPNNKSIFYRFPDEIIKLIIKEWI